MAFSFGASANASRTDTNYGESGTKTTQKVMTQKGMDKIIYDILASDQGLAALATGENLSGGYGSSAKAQIGQDLVVKLAAELANLTAKTVETRDQTGFKDEKTVGGGAKAGSVICTELNRQGLLQDELYEAGHAHFLSLSPYTVAGYRAWAEKCVPILARHPRLAARIAPIAIARYEMTTGRVRWNLVGALTIYIAQPICYLIGRIKELTDGNVQRTA